ncbi:hypothetical protein JM18_006549 [Phytophthora kernoviae]|uniref:Uncharacterized protein n=2 Tax=Phytophthora kernoviae TaxID=325452 RepID=A0A921SGD9_9STRA|nr:hypothetical protein G195_007994 [Phytophthora kernoviae 00238/432]KAG2521486.1 hypothetical protein JM18_006549 [Phytophthora kernoviae]
MVKRGSKSKTRRGSPVDQLQAALTRSLKESVAETVVSVCEQFEEAVNEVATPTGDSSSGGYDRYYANCRRLVDYIQQSMETSSGFGEQMDRIILACHSGATERVLSSVVTKQLWFHRRGDMLPFSAAEEKKSSNIDNEKISSSGSSTRSDIKKKPKALSQSHTEPQKATRASTESPAIHTRSNVNTGKRVATRGIPHNTQPTKRPRRAAVRKIVHDTSDEEKEEVEEDEEEEKPTITRKGKKTQPHAQDDDDDLLPFKDAIGELCYPDRRSPADTKFFKDRLRKSIQFVDALLCKPPPGKVCARGCKKIRAQMCSSSTPCKNKMCRIWHDVEAHTDRCQNPQCEFKNRILLRETMHKVDIKNLQMADVKAELQNKKDALKEVASGNGVKRQEEKALLENDITQLEHDLEEGNDELGVLEATKKTFWGILNDIGIELRDDVVDEFPNFSAHYEEKKAPRKARTSPKSSAAANQQPSSAVGRSTRAARRMGGGPHGNDADDDGGDDADAKSASGNIPRRTARRSTSGGPRGPLSTSGIDEETKGEEEQESNHMQEQEQEHSDNKNYNREDEPPLPPVGPPPFRQNPELDRSYALASGYSIQPSADDLEAPAIAMDHDSTTQVDIPGGSVPAEVQPLADVRQTSAEISGALESLSSNPPVGPVTTADLLNGTKVYIDNNALDQNLPLELQLGMLRGKLSRRNQVLEVIRRAYYRDVIIIKEELRLHGGKLGHTGSATSSSKELKAARQEMVRATKGEQQMRNVVHRMRSEAKQMEEVNEALQQRVRALMKENAYTLEQLQAARKIEREQKVIIAGLRSKLQLSQATQDEIDRLMSEYKDVKQQLIRSNHDRDIFSASNNHLKEELAEVTKVLHIVKVEKAQIESDFGTNYYRLQEETKKSRQLTADLAARDEQLKDKVLLCNEQQQSLTSLKEELVSTLQRFEQTKRHLEDQLIEEERTREEMQEQNLEFRRLNKKLVRDLENAQNQSLDLGIPLMFDDLDGSDKQGGTNSKKDRPQRQPVAGQAAAMRNNDSAGAAEMMEAMLRQVDEAKRDQQHEAERNVILMGFLRQISEFAHDINENKALLMELELDVVPPDEPTVQEENVQMMELQRKKREVRRKVLMEKAMKKFSIMCHNRAELIGIEMQKIRTNFERMREDLDQAENKIDSDQLHTQTLEAEISKLRLTVEVGKTNLGKIEKTLKQTAEELNEYTINFKLQTEELVNLKSEHNKVQEDQKRLTLQIFEKTKAWQKEISTNDMSNQKIERLEETISDISSQRLALQKKVSTKYNAA